jgi:hypothetical protein
MWASVDKGRSIVRRAVEELLAQFDQLSTARDWQKAGALKHRLEQVGPLVSPV